MSGGAGHPGALRVMLGLALGLTPGCAHPTRGTTAGVPAERLCEGERAPQQPLALLQPQLHNRERRPATPDARRALRVVTFNVHYARNVGALVRALRAHAALATADVYLLQEVRTGPARAGGRACRLAQAFGLSHLYVPAWRTPGGGTHGLEILSRWPLREVSVVELERFPLPRGEPRIAIAATVEAPGRRLRVYNVHLDVRLNAAERLRQLGPVVAAAASERLPVVVGGDFNTNPFCWLKGVLPLPGCPQETQVDRFMRAHGFAAPSAGIGPTDRIFSTMRLDAFYTKGVTTPRARVAGTVESSDHSPLWVDVSGPGLAAQH